MDDDSDLDAIVWLSWSAGVGYFKSQLIWVENDALQAPPPPNPYDLDHDGHVNTADLSLLLMEFTD